MLNSDFQTALNALDQLDPKILESLRQELLQPFHRTPVDHLLDGLGVNRLAAYEMLFAKCNPNDYDGLRPLQE